VHMMLWYLEHSAPGVVDIYIDSFSMFLCVFRYTVSVIADGRALGRNRTFRKE
jgi:hypothetical protein